MLLCLHPEGCCPNCYSPRSPCAVQILNDVIRWQSSVTELLIVGSNRANHHALIHFSRKNIRLGGQVARGGIVFVYSLWFLGSTCSSFFYIPRVDESTKGHECSGSASHSCLEKFYLLYTIIVLYILFDVKLNSCPSHKGCSGDRVGRINWLRHFGGTSPPTRTGSSAMNVS